MCACNSNKSSQQLVPATLAAYDSAVLNQAHNTKLAYLRIDSLRKIATTDSSLSSLSNLARAYTALSLDSALKTYERIFNLARQQHNDSAALSASVEECRVFLRQGRDADAIIMYQSIPADSLRGAQKIAYHFAGMQLGLMLHDKSSGHFTLRRFQLESIKHAEALLKMLPEQAPLYDFALAAKYKFEGKEAMQIAPLISIVENPTAEPWLKSSAYFWLAVYHLHQQGPNSPSAGNFLLNSAVIDLNNSLLTNYSLAVLGQWFYDNGDHSRGMEAWRIALNNSNTTGSSNQWAQSQSLAKTTFSVIDTNSRIYTISAITLIVLLIVALTLAYLAWRSRLKHYGNMRRLKHTLSRLQQERDSHLIEFAKLFTVTLNHIDEHDKLTRRKITAGQTDELLRLLKSGKLQTDHSKDLARTFDAAVHHVFPHFVEAVNTLLTPESQLEVPEPDAPLTPEVRVAALARLGIDDGTLVARFLGLSVNTVYTYRNKMRSRAINRDTFDADLRALFPTQI